MAPGARPVEATVTPPVDVAGMVPVVPIRRLRASRLPDWFVRTEPVVLGVSGFVAVLLLWEMASASGWIDRFFFSAPSLIAAAGAREVLIPRFWDDVRISALELGLGSALALVLGVAAGLAIGWYRRLGYVFDPWLNFFNSLPRIALLPLLILWFGLGLEMKIAVVFLGAFFAIAVSTAQGVKTVDRAYLDVGRSLRASQRRIFTSIVLPGTVPFIIAGVRVAIARSLIGVVVAEFYTQTGGIGVIIVKSQQALNTDRMLFGIFLFTISGVALSLLVAALERRVQRWKAAPTGSADA